MGIRPRRDLFVNFAMLRFLLGPTFRATHVERLRRIKVIRTVFPVLALLAAYLLVVTAFQFL